MRSKPVPHFCLLGLLLCTPSAWAQTPQPRPADLEAALTSIIDELGKARATFEPYATEATRQLMSAAPNPQLPIDKRRPGSITYAEHDADATAILESKQMAQSHLNRLLTNLRARHDAFARPPEQQQAPQSEGKTFAEKGAAYSKQLDVLKSRSAAALDALKNYEAIYAAEKAKDLFAAQDKLYDLAYKSRKAEANYRLANELVAIYSRLAAFETSGAPIRRTVVAPAGAPAEVDNSTPAIIKSVVIRPD
jgi:hypothetical protein